MRQLVPHFIDTHLPDQHGTFTAVVLFVDISGFTRLTETLLQHRKDGAEVLTQVLNSIFNPLVETVYQHGGFISTFAGDSFTAIFDQADAAHHALKTADFIRHFFSTHPTARTPFGAFELAVKIGLGAGEIQWGILGQDTDQTYYFRGEAIERAAEAESHARSGQILASPQAIVGTEDHLTKEAQDNLLLIQEVHIEIPPLGSALPALTPEVLARFVPPEVTQLGTTAEFRDVASVFISAEESESLDRFIELVIELSRTYGGYFRHVDFGDKGPVIVVLFGAPVTYENNVSRAADFLLSLRKRGGMVRWRAGFTFGIVYAGLIGGAQRADYAAIGDVVNLAARLMTAADWENVWVSPEVTENLENKGYLFEALGPRSFKGKSQTIPVSRLLGKRQERAKSAIYVGQLIGRSAELAQLNAFIQPLYDNAFAGVITIYGDAGMGKSRLIYEFSIGLRQVTWFTCPADEILRLSLNPFRHFLRRYFNQSPENTPELNEKNFNEVLNSLLADLESYRITNDRAWELRTELERTRSMLAALVDIYMEDSLYTQLDPTLRLENTLIALKTLILAESIAQPVVIYIEDAQWLDAGTQQFLKMLTRNVAEYPFTVILSSRYRDDGGKLELSLEETVPLAVMELKALANEGIRELAEQVLDAKVTDELAAFLNQRASGNPFFIEQLALDLRERGLLVNTRGRMRLTEQIDIVEVPTSINTVLVARLDRLTAQVKSVVQTAAVLGQEFEIQVLSQMLRSERDLTDKIKRAEAYSIWLAISEIRYLFQHALMRDAAYDMQLRARLRELHLLAAQAIEEVYRYDLESHYADLAYHYSKAEQGHLEQRYSRLAGEQSALKYAHVDATRYFTRALELTPETDLDGRFDLLMAREAVYTIQGMMAARLADLQALEALVAQLHDPEREIHVMLRRARYAEDTADYPTAIQTAQALLEKSDDPAVQAQAECQWGVSLVRQADYPTAQEHLEKSLELAEQSSQPKVQLEALRALGAIYTYRGDYDAARRNLEGSLQISRRLQDRQGECRALNNLGAISYYQGDYPQTRIICEQTIEIAREIGDRRVESVTIGNIGVIAYNQGDFSRGMRYLQQAIYLGKETGNTLILNVSLNNLASLLLNNGILTLAERYLVEGRDLALRTGDRHRELSNRSGWFLLAYYRSQYVEAEATAYDVRELALELGSKPLEALAFTQLGHVLLNTQRLEEAFTCFDQAHQINTELKNQAYLEDVAGLAKTTLLLGRAQEALQHVDTIITYLQHNRISVSIEPSWIYLMTYEVLAALQDPRAENVLEDAYNEMQRRLQTMESEEYRQMFLENITPHKVINTLWREKHPQ
ncbi:MAG: hypothetical protein OHK0046_25550 [Anaerolineae bacterium]